jgi:hypothetical protein
MRGTPLFDLGRVVMTPGAMQLMQQHNLDPFAFLFRHVRGDWGVVDKQDGKANDEAVVHGTRILSAYMLTPAERVWIITEADRSSTCILLPTEY